MIALMAIFMTSFITIFMIIVIIFMIIVIIFMIIVIIFIVFFIFISLNIVNLDIIVLYYWLYYSQGS